VLCTSLGVSMRLHPDWLRQSSSSLVKKQPKNAYVHLLFHVVPDFRIWWHFQKITAFTTLATHTVELFLAPLFGGGSKSLTGRDSAHASSSRTKNPTRRVDRTRGLGNWPLRTSSSSVVALIATKVQAPGLSR
jgi:hypothetical protein